MESDTAERLHFHFSLSCIGEGNDSPLQCPCLENPRDGGAWWSAVYPALLTLLPGLTFTALHVFPPRLPATCTVGTAVTSPTSISSAMTATSSPPAAKTQASCSGGSCSPGKPRGTQNGRGAQTRVSLGHCDFCFVCNVLTNLRKTMPFTGHLSLADR